MSVAVVVRRRDDDLPCRFLIPEALLMSMHPVALMIRLADLAASARWGNSQTLFIVEICTALPGLGDEVVVVVVVSRFRVRGALLLVERERKEGRVSLVTTNRTCDDDGNGSPCACCFLTPKKHEGSQKRKKYARVRELAKNKKQS